MLESGTARCENHGFCGFAALEAVGVEGTSRRRLPTPKRPQTLLLSPKINVSSEQWPPPFSA